MEPVSTTLTFINVYFEGAKKVYIGGQLVYTVGMVIMAATLSPVTVILLSPTAGVMYATLFTLPYMIVANYHNKEQVSVANYHTKGQVSVANYHNKDQVKVANYHTKGKVSVAKYHTKRQVYVRHANLPNIT